MRKILSTACLALALVWSSTGIADSGVLGTWLTAEGVSHVEVEEESDGTISGRIVWLRDDPEKLDDQNPDAALKARKIMGLKILYGFKADDAAKTKWKNGKIYDPKNGKTYDCKMELEGEELNIRGYVGIPLFGRTTTWKRVTKSASATSAMPPPSALAK